MTHRAPAPARRNHSPAHPGVSVESRDGGRYMVRWSERSDDGKRIQRGYTLVGSAADAEKLAIEVAQSLAATGTWSAPAHRTPARPLVADISQVFAGYYLAQEQLGRRPPTLRSLKHALNLWLQLARENAGAKELPVTLLSPAYLRQVYSLIEGSDSWRYRVACSVVGAWVHGWDERARYPSLPEPPRDTSHCIPRPPKKAPGRPAPTWAEVDAVLRHVPAGAKLHAMILRGTGLRPATVANIRWSDLDFQAGTMIIRHDKREAAEGRIIPIAPWLIRAIASAGQSSLEKDTSKIISGLNEALGVAVDRAVEAGALRKAAVTGEGRSRRATLFRSAFQAELRREGVQDRDIDFLVGHNASSIRDQHYDPATFDNVRAAVEKVPPPATESRTGVISLRERGSRR